MRLVIWLMDSFLLKLDKGRKIKMNIYEENEIEISAEIAEELSNQKGDED